MPRARRAIRSATPARPKVSLDEAVAVAGAPSQDFVALDDALNALEAVDPGSAKWSRCASSAGMSVEETAAALHLSVGTIKRDWRLAKAWLARELEWFPT